LEKKSVVFTYNPNDLFLLCMIMGMGWKEKAQ
jgi:hypothetical protein